MKFQLINLENINFVKSKDSVQTEITIVSSGNVEGKVGAARFEHAQVVKNRNGFGRFFNLATDYAIEGKLVGKVFEEDSSLEKEITIPLWLENGYLCGDIFMNKGFEIYPLGTISLN